MLCMQQELSHKTNKISLEQKPGRKHTQMSTAAIFGPFPVFLLVSSRGLHTFSVKDQPSAR